MPKRISRRVGRLGPQRGLGQGSAAGAERHGPLPQGLLRLRCRRDGIPAQLVPSIFRLSPGAIPEPGPAGGVGG